MEISGSRIHGSADAAKARQLRDKGITATDIAKMLGLARTLFNLCEENH
jgi:hypothetical protein